MLYKVEIKEYLSKVIEIEGEDTNDVLAIVKKAYRNEEIVLNENNYVCTEFQVIGD